MEHTLRTLCDRLHGELIGDGNTIVRGISTAERVQPGELTFAENPARITQVLATRAAAIVVSQDVRDLQGRPGIRVQNPKLAFARLLELFYPEPPRETGVHPTAVLGRNVQLGEGVAVCAYAVIGNDVSIGRGTTIGAGVVVGDGTTIGEHCTLHPNVVLYRRTQLGDRVQIHGGSVIGGDGFGYVFDRDAYVKIPQVGNVVIGNDVEIGCNACVDRSTIGSTVIGDGTKLDNFVQIAHNNHIGKHVMLSGQVGLAGSVTVDDYVVMGGKAGAVDHMKIGKGAKAGAGSIITKTVPPGETVFGYPARPAHVAKRQMAAVARLPELLKRLTRLLGPSTGSQEIPQQPGDVVRVRKEA